MRTKPPVHGGHPRVRFCMVLLVVAGRMCFRDCGMGSAWEARLAWEARARERGFPRGAQKTPRCGPACERCVAHALRGCCCSGNHCCCPREEKRKKGQSFIKHSLQLYSFTALQLTAYSCLAASCFPPPFIRERTNKACRTGTGHIGP